jgi:hypothetical protein
MCTNHKSPEQAGTLKTVSGTKGNGNDNFQDVYNRYEAQLQNEDDLTNNRVKWLLGTQTLLFAAIKVGNSNSNPKVLEAIRFVGFASSIAIGVSILAATLCFAEHRKKLIDKFESVKNEIRRIDYPQIDRCKYILFMGDVAGIALPITFALGWFFMKIVPEK